MHLTSQGFMASTADALIGDTEQLGLPEREGLASGRAAGRRRAGSRMAYDVVGQRSGPAQVAPRAAIRAWICASLAVMDPCLTNR